MSILDPLMLRAMEHTNGPLTRTLMDDGVAVSFISDEVRAEYERLYRLSKFDLVRLQRAVAIASAPYLWK